VTEHHQQLTFVAPGKLEWRETSAPGLDSDRAALVRPVAVATCDLDAFIIAGASPFPPPFALGHECVAEVVDVGDDVVNMKPGQLVSVPFQISCGDCAACRRGRTANCTGVDFMSTYGFGPAVGRWGGFLSDLVLVPFAEHMLVALPDGIAPETVASASDNISDAWRAVAPPLQDEPAAAVLVVGGMAPGSIGLYAAAIAVALGSERVVYADHDGARQRLARALGAEIQSAPFPGRIGPFPITVDHSASAEGISFALRSTAPDGICTSTAIYFGDPPPLPLLSMYTFGVTFKTGRCNARPAIPQVLALVERGALAPELVTTHVVGWADAPDALAERDWTKLVIRRD
jgi:threonine dehydrogenase-like Zn-dependent dehydrogenase